MGRCCFDKKHQVIAPIILGLYWEENLVPIDGLYWTLMVLIRSGIERKLPTVDWVKFMWLATHPSEQIHNDEGLPGNEIIEDLNCNAIAIWESYNKATERIPELSGKSSPGHFVTICGKGMVV